MKRYKLWQLCLLLTVMTLGLQSCLGIGGSNGNFKTAATTSKGDQIGINNDSTVAFSGKIYFTLDHNLYVLDGSKTLHQLTKGLSVYDPAVSPDGKWVAFIARYQNWSDLDMIPAGGGALKILRTGVGKYVPNPNSDVPISTAFWYAQPAWSPDSTHLLFLSDWAKTYTNPGVDAFLLDLQIFSISINDPTATPQTVAYTTYGDGGLRDPAYRPKHPDQIVYTGYSYDATTQIQQRIGIYLEDPNAIANNPGVYRAGVPSIEKDPAVEITPNQDNLANLEPAFSPDGNTVAYVRRETSGNMSIYAMPVPDGVTQNPNNPTVEQEAVQPYNKSVKLLSGTPYVSQPVWSPDGKQLLYVGYTNTTFDLWLANVVKDAKTGAYSVSGSPIQLTNAQGHLDAESRPCWTP
jgi:Tol biopolymer transport system component